MDCNCINGWIRKTVTCAKISPKMVNPRDIAGEFRRFIYFLEGGTTLERDIRLAPCKHRHDRALTVAGETV